MHVPINIIFCVLSLLFVGWRYRTIRRTVGIHVASEKGYLEIATALINEGASVNATDNFGNVPLHQAAQAGHQAIVKLLLEKGAEIDKKNREGKTPFHQAAYHGHRTIVAILLDNRAQIDLCSEQGSTALHYAVFGSHQPIVQILLQRGASVGLNNKEAGTPLHYAASEGHQTIAEILLNNGANVNARNNLGRTPLHYAAHRNHLLVAELLLAWHAKLNLACSQGETPLHHAANQGNHSIAKILLDKGAIVDVKDKNSNTPLHLASAQGYLTTVQVLLDRQARFHLTNINGDTPLSIVAGSNIATRIVQLLLQQGTYSHNDQVSEGKLQNHWQATSIQIEANKNFYTSLLAAGVFPQKVLPESLQIVRDNLETTVAEWLNPLELLPEEYAAFTPTVLRVLPQLIQWLDRVTKEEAQLHQEKEALKNYYSTSTAHLEGLKHFFLIPKATVEGERLEVLKGLQATIMPIELLFLIRDSLILDILVTTLTRCYPLPRRVADYLIADGMAHLKEYKLFHTRLIQHDWLTPCSPPDIKRSMHYSRS